MARHLLWFCQVVLSTIIGILVFLLISGLTAAKAISLVYWLGIASAFIVTFGLLFWMDRILISRWSLSALTVLSQKRKMNWASKHPTLIGVAVIYSIVAVVGAVVVRIVMTEAKETGDPSTAWSLWMIFLASEVALLVVGMILAFLVDRYQLREKISANNSDVTAKVRSSKILLVSLAVPALLLYTLFVPLYVSPAIGKMVFELTASSQAKLNKEFAQELSILTETSVDYNKNIIYDFVGRGADVNTGGIHGTPLSFAARAGDAEFVQDLIAKGADAKKCSARDQASIEKLTKLGSASSSGN